MSDSDEPVTLINVFEVPADEVDEFVVAWRERAKIMHAAPGFRSVKLHRALDSSSRFQVINVAQWESRQAWQAATDNPEFQQRIRAVAANQKIAANPALYQVIVDSERL